MSVYENMQNHDKREKVGTFWNKVLQN